MKAYVCDMKKGFSRMLTITHVGIGTVEDQHGRKEHNILLLE
jgi:hypothetical protein